MTSRWLSSKRWPIPDALATMGVQQVERGKGVEASSRLVVRSFVAGTRRSVMESIGWGGHDPIPPVGSEVRVFLQRRGDQWEVVDPNGFQSAPGEPLASLPRPAGRPRFTLLLPLELWLGVLVVAAFVAVLWALARRLFRRAPTVSP